MRKEQYITFETAKLAKEKGFNSPENCDAYYNKKKHLHGKEYYFYKKFLQCPTQAVLARWLRELHNMCVEVYVTAYGFVWCISDTNGGTSRYDSEVTGPNDGGAWDTYEDAKENGLQEALKHIESEETK
jgi:hypothetical protein